MASAVAALAGYGVIKFFGLGSKWPWPPVLSAELAPRTIDLILQASPKAVLDSLSAFFQTDFRPDMRAFTMPTLINHGDSDQNAPHSTGRCLL